MGNEARVHTLLYFGPFDPNFRSLTPETTTYVDHKEPQRSFTAQTPTGKVNGLSFRYMRLSRSPEQDLVVGVGNVVLRAPVVLVHERHMDGKWFVADSPAYLSDDSAMQLLADMMVANPEYRDLFARLVREKLGSSA